MLNRQLIAQQGGQYLNCDVPADRAVILSQAGARRHRCWPHSHTLGEIRLARADEFLSGLVA